MSHGRAIASRAARASQLAVSLVFIHSGGRVWRAPDGPAAASAAFLGSVKRQLPAWAQVEDRRLVRLNAALQVGAGLGLASGRHRSASAYALATSLVPTTLAAYPFWQLPGGPERARVEGEFLKNVALIGGLLAIAGR